MTEADTPRLHLGILEMGKLGEIAVRVVAANLQAVIGIAVDLIGPHDVPEHAYLNHRQQYDAGLILKYLTERSSPDHVKLLALTNLDLCIPILTYVFGEAEIGGRAAIVSGFRLRHNSDGSPVSLDRYYERLAKVAVHEVAHTLSLYHCETPHCLMNFSAKVDQLDSLAILFCERCEFMLQSSLRRLKLESEAAPAKSSVKTRKRSPRK